MKSLSPNIFVRDMPATLKFYRLLGFELTMSVPAEPGAELVWAMMVSGKITIMFQTFASLGDTLAPISRNDGGSLLLYINLKNVRAFFEKIRDLVTVIVGLEKTFYGATEFSILDNNNYVLTFAEHEAA